jgi:Skp family chaperone for outer membrane proteins
MNKRTMGTAVVSIPICLILCVAWIGSSFAGGTTIAKMSLNRLNQDSKTIQSVLKDFKRKENSSRAGLRAMAEELQSVQKKARNDKTDLSKDEQKKLALQLKAKREAFDQASREARLKLSFYRKSVQRTLRRRIRDIIKKIAKKEGVSVVMREESLLYSSGIPDISEKVIAELDSVPFTGVGTEPKQGSAPAAGSKAPKKPEQKKKKEEKSKDKK